MLAMLFLGPELAPYASAYSLILMGWCCGLLVGVYRRPPDGRRLPVLGFAVVTLMAVLGVTVPLSQVLAAQLPAVLPGVTQLDARGLFFAVAMGVPAVGHNWFDAAGWLVDLARRRWAKEA